MRVMLLVGCPLVPYGYNYLSLIVIEICPKTFSIILVSPSLWQSILMMLFCSLDSVLFSKYVRLHIFCIFSGTVKVQGSRSISQFWG